MKRMHVHVKVADLEQAIGFYSTLFAIPPTVQKPDYAKWMLEDPRVNFAISTCGERAAPGLDHLGMQVEADGELTEVADRLRAADAHVLDEPGARCCYARSDKAWVADPAGLLWETFHSHGPITEYGEDRGRARDAGASACCSSDVADAVRHEASASVAPVARGACCGSGDTASA